MNQKAKLELFQVNVITCLIGKPCLDFGLWNVPKCG